MSIVMTIRSSCELETYIVAVERIKEYTELPSEVSKDCSSLCVIFQIMCLSSFDFLLP